jgi:hypothetical protein
MTAVRRALCQLWEDHRKVMRVVAAATWGLLMPLIYLAVAAEPLKVGGLPVT